jgi:hypothetical protein
MSVISTSSNSLLAKLLATENLTVQHQSGIKTAMFDLKNRILMLPVWQDISTDLEHLLIGHETAHAIDTPGAEEYRNAYESIAKRVFGDELDTRLTKTVSGFLNVIEDARIDKRQKRRYPGLRKNYLLGYKELMERDFFGTRGRDINGMNFIDRLNIYFKGGNVNLNIEFTPEEKALLKRVENAETFAEVVELTEEVYRFCKGQIENQHDDIQINIGKPGDGEDGDEYDMDMSYDANAWGDEGEDDGEDGDGDDEGKSQGTGQGDIAPNGSGSPSRGAGSSGVVNGKAPESVTDSIWEQKREELVRDANTDYIYLSLPQIDYSHCIDDYKTVLNDWRNQIKGGSNGWGNTLDAGRFAEYRREFMEWRSKEKDTISFLVKEFEQRKSAELYSRISIAKTGMIDTNKLHSYKYNDDIFRRLSVIPEGKNHGFVMFLDWSGSMQFGLRHTMKQLFTLVLFCKQIQVPFEVYAFKDCNLKKGDAFSYNGENILHLNQIGLRQFLSSKMNTAELNEAMSVMWAMGHGVNLYCEGMGGTPLNEALILAPKVVNDFRAKYKLEIVNTIVLTDGEANGYNGVYNETTPRVSAFGRRKKVYLYTDKITGKTHEVYPHGQPDYTSNTNVMLRILKEQTGCNLIGFFLFTETWNKFMYRFIAHDTSEHKSKAQKFWKDNKFYPVKSAGYDEYFVINASALKEEDVGLEIDNNKSTKIMAKAFSKFAAKKAVNRVLLRNFIDHVTGQAKKVA